MQLYPKFYSAQTGKAERTIFSLFQRCALDKGYRAFHSMLLADHPRKAIGETDFAVLMPDGILIIEVKGGVISVSDRNWLVTSLSGETKTMPDPFAQATGNMFALAKELEKNAGFDRRNHFLACAVIFPDCRFDGVGQGILSDILFDGRHLAVDDLITAIVEKAKDYWIRHDNGAREPFTGEQWSKIEQWLRPRFHGVPSLAAQRAELTARRVALLDEQMDFLERCSTVKRFICEGGAGTGKTLLGLELIRMKRAQGMSACMIVPNPYLREHIISAGHPPDMISLASTSETGRKYQFVCLDEAQDMMMTNAMDMVDRLIEGGLQNGSWGMMMDTRNQSGVSGLFEQECATYVESLCQERAFLVRNVRNSLEIIQITKELTSRDIGRRGIGSGPNVEFRYYSDQADLAAKVMAELRQLADAGVPNRDIVFLGKSKQSEWMLGRHLANNGTEFQSLGDLLNRGNQWNRFSYGRIADFKGLESYAVLIDIGEFGSEGLSSPDFYVGITRAVAHMVLFCPQALKREVGLLQARNIKQMKSHLA